MPIRRIALPIALAVALLTPATASAITLESQITSPAGPTTYLYGEEGSKFTVAGTSNMAEVELRCYYGKSGGSSYGLGEGPIKVTSGAFSHEIAITSLPSGPCQLRAVPPTEKSPLPPGTEDEFQGPLIVASQFSGATGASNFYGSADSLTGTMTFEDAGNYGLESLLYSATAHEGERLFYGDLDLNTTTESGPTVDGTRAYLPAAARELEGELEKKAKAASEPFTPLTGKPTVTLSKSFDEATHQMSVTEEAPLAFCSPSSSTYPATLKSCTSMVSAGVTLVRSYVSSNEGDVATVSDRWVSTNGVGHTVNARYEMENFHEEIGGGAFEFPGEGVFSGRKKGESRTLPAGSGTILLKQLGSTPEGGNGENPQGAIVYDASPSAPVKFLEGTSEADASEFLMPYERAIPAGGSTSTLRFTFVQSFSLASVKALAASALASYSPSVSIHSPAEGTTILSATAAVAVSGNASDGVGLTGLTVAGKPVSVGAGGAWTATVPLTPGANTITATATNQSGLTSSATVHVTYLPPPTAKLTIKASGSGGHVTFTLACAGLAGTVCKVHGLVTTLEKLHNKNLIGLSARTRHKTVTVGSITTTIPAGTTEKLTIKLNSTGSKLLKRFHKLPVKLSVVLEGQGGAANATLLSETLTIRPAAHKKHKH